MKGNSTQASFLAVCVETFGCLFQEFRFMWMTKLLEMVEGFHLESVCPQAVWVHLLHMVM